MSFGKRPELSAPPEIFYSNDEAKKYTQNSRIIEIQSEMSERAIELLELPDDDEPKMLLDLGCGSGLSGEAIESAGHCWVGMDISEAMLNIAREREVSGDLIQADLGNGIPFRPGTFDGAISISALQWLCNADKTCHNPVQRLSTFFTTLYAALNNGTRAVFQFYPQDERQTNLILSQAKRAGFNGGLVIDYPESTKAKKYYLVLIVGGVTNPLMPKPLSNVPGSTVDYAQRDERQQRRPRHGVKNIREWIINKKERRRKQGKETRPDSKFTGRKRPDKF